MPTNFENDPGGDSERRPNRIVFLAIALAVVVAVVIANRQIDRTTAVAPDKSASDSTVGLSPQK